MSRAQGALDPGTCLRSEPARSACSRPGYGVSSECGRLRSVVLHRPGPEIEEMWHPPSVLWTAAPDSAKAREQHDGLAEVYRGHGVAVHYLLPAAETQDLPNLCFVRDTFAMTPEGAILGRPASAVRAREVDIVSRCLRDLGMRVVVSVNGAGSFEGADLIVLDEDLAFVATGNRTNSIGASLIKRLLLEMGIGEVVEVKIGSDSMHLDCALSIVDRGLALLRPSGISRTCVESLRRHGYRVLEVPEAEEPVALMGINGVALEPGIMILPSNTPVTQRILRQAGVGCIEVDISELLKGAGGVHCLTGVLCRDPL